MDKNTKISKQARTAAGSASTILSDAAAEALSKHKGDLDLSGLAKLPDSAAESLSRHSEGLYLSGLLTLSARAAGSLSRHKGFLVLSGLTKLSAAAAESLGMHRGDLYLEGLPLSFSRAFAFRSASDTTLAFCFLATANRKRVDGLGSC